MKINHLMKIENKDHLSPAEAEMGAELGNMFQDHMTFVLNILCETFTGVICIEKLEF